MPKPKAVTAVNIAANGFSFKVEKNNFKAAIESFIEVLRFDILEVSKNIAAACKYEAEVTALVQRTLALSTTTLADLATLSLSSHNVANLSPAVYVPKLPTIRIIRSLYLINQSIREGNTVIIFVVRLLNVIIEGFNLSASSIPASLMAFLCCSSLARFVSELIAACSTAMFVFVTA